MSVQNAIYFLYRLAALFFSHSQSDHFNLNLHIAVTNIIIHHLLMVALNEQTLGCCDEAQKEPLT